MATRTILTDDFKKAIAGLSPREKDKLLFRLLPKEPALVAKLTFELLEGGESQDERRQELLELLESELKVGTQHFYSPGYLLLGMRSLSGEITRHVKTTKDKYGEIQANLLLLNDAMRPNLKKIVTFSAGKCRTFNNYVVSRTFKILALLDKQHPDIHLDFHDDLRELGENIQSIPTLRDLAKQENLNVSALLRGEVPA